MENHSANRTRNKPGKAAGDNPRLLAIGAAFAARRRDLGILQQALADAAGISRSTLHTIEHGGTGVRWEKVAAVAEALGMDMEFIPRPVPHLLPEDPQGRAGQPAPASA